MKVYTGSGDKGKTSLFSGQRVSKDDQRVEAYGVIDELSSVLGGLSAFLPDNQTEIMQDIVMIQSDLFSIGALLATTPDAPSFKSLKIIGPEKYQALENKIDKMDAELKPLKSFILPGGSQSAAFAHIARTVCRRAERRMTALDDDLNKENTPEYFKNMLVYINRLSDYCFVLARYCNHLSGVKDIGWQADDA